MHLFLNKKALKICNFFECDICWVNFDEKYFLKQHVSSVHEGKQLVTCDICNNNFDQRDHFKQHVFSIHEGKHAVTCDTCNANFDKIEPACFVSL